jgi:hypothetical protein
MDNLQVAVTALDNVTQADIRAARLEELVKLRVLLANWHTVAGSELRDRTERLHWRDRRARLGRNYQQKSFVP